MPRGNGAAAAGGRSGNDVTTRRVQRQGLTLVELIVVLAIVGLLTALAVPGLARIGAFSNDKQSRAAREIFQLLRAARVYASTYNVNTAVVYALDTYVPPTTDPNNLALAPESFLQDSLTGAPVRYIEAAAMMYALPGSEEKFFAPLSSLWQQSRDLATQTANGIPQNCTDDFDDAFVPAPGDEGAWKALDIDVAVLLRDPDTFVSLYDSLNPRYDIGRDACSVGLPALGMSRGIPVILDYDTLDGEQANGLPADQLAQYLSRFPAHVFTPDGRLLVEGVSQERFTFLVGPRPDQGLDARLNDADRPEFVYLDTNGQPVKNYRAVPIEIYRSTGRVKIAS